MTAAKMFTCMKVLWSPYQNTELEKLKIKNVRDKLLVNLNIDAP